MKISNTLIRTLTPCYDPSRVVKDETEELEPTLWVQKYRGKLQDKDIVWLLCHNEFLSDRQLRLFAVWCAREALKLVKNPDHRSIEACNVAERFANGQATSEELARARAAAYAAYDAAYAAAAYDAAAAAYDAAYAAATYDAAAAADAAYAAATYDAAAAADDAAAAAYDAAYAAATDKARTAQVDKLLEILQEEKK